jgi:hypothetical protein
VNFDGFTPYPIERFSSLVEMDDPTNLPLGVLPVARNVKFRLTRVLTRDGIDNDYGFTLPDGGAVTGLSSLKYSGNPDVQVPIAFSALGDLYKEQPVGSGNVVQISSPQLTLPVGASMQVAAAYQKGYLAFGDLVHALGAPAVYNLQTGKLDPLSMLPVGNPWEAGRAYQVGECITPAAPVGGNGHIYRCTQAGTTGNAQPVFPTGALATVGDGGVIWQENTPVMSQSVAVGNICAGLRYMVVLFLNRNGYLTGMSEASVVSYNGAVDGFKLQVDTIPTGPANTAARICCFTPAGQLSALAGNGISTAGPYFWIAPNFPAAAFNPSSNSSILASIPGGVTIGDVANGIQMTSTLINDNVTTSATFNFTDDYLKLTEQDVSANFRKIQVPNCSDVFYSKTLRRMFYAVDTLPSGSYVSLQNDPEGVYGDGIIQAAENNGERRTAFQEYNGVVYLLKERSGHVVSISSDDPSQWNTTQVWGISSDGKGVSAGPCGPRAVDVCTNFMCFVHRSGVYIFEGGQPYRISKEIPVTWSRINWAYQHKIWVMIDDETREIRIGVPYGQSTVPNIVLKCNYEEIPGFSAPSFAPPIHFSPYMGKEIAAGTCYKWSVDDIAANVCIRAERVLPTPAGGFPPGFDLPTIQSQILFGSSNADGEVSPIIPGTLDDNGQGINSQIETACPAIMNGDGKVLKSLMGPSRLGGVQLNIDGEGQGSVYVLALRGKDPSQGGSPLIGKAKADRGAEIKLKKPWIAGIPYSCGGQMTNERMRLRITNDATAGVGFDLKWAAIFAQPVTSARAN